MWLQILRFNLIYTNQIKKIGNLNARTPLSIRIQSFILPVDDYLTSFDRAFSLQISTPSVLISKLFLMVTSTSKQLYSLVRLELLSVDFLLARVKGNPNFTFEDYVKALEVSANRCSSGKQTNLARNVVKRAFAFV